MTKKIFRSIMIAAGAVLFASLVVIMGCLYNYFEDVRKDGLKEELGLFAAAVEEDGVRYLEKVHSDYYRITWIAADGTVLYDTVTGTENPENHLEREEVSSALITGEGWSNRYSDTLFEKTIYYAKRMADGTVLRISVSSKTVGVLALGMVQPILVVAALALILSGILANSLSKWIVKPLNSLNLEEPLSNDTYEELSPLLNRINKQNGRIRAQMEEKQRRAAEFAQITACMSEGLVLMDKDGIILSMNPAAEKIFELQISSVGRDFLTVYRDHEMNLCLKGALETGHGEIRQSRFGREYQFVVNRIESAGEVIGSVLLIFDVTEKVLAEQHRREFTANVSHELKTPLQGIIGSAELIENNMVKQEDIPRFVGHIRKEAMRLVTLVGDIIRLSQLDEKAELAKEPVDLLEVAKEAAEDLSPLAREKQVEMQVDGVSAVISGVRKLLFDVVYNLAENAVKYNNEGGKVMLTVSVSGGKAILNVADTGIGIPKEHVGRVFERFYRVDKSHSKESGGTGLGLSIVKHAVLYHQGTLDIKSEPGRGTEICARFPV